ncbi:MAG: phosphatidylglycerophosphatase A [Nitrospinae bacterium]|nr:phosphatidylglycerophosphatase A [Nitrospinota bacterium]
MKQSLRNYHYFVATGAHSGYFPVASGTAGTAAAIVLYYPLSFLPLWLYIIVVVFLYCLGEISADFVEYDLQEKDPSIVVIDEFLGYLVTMAFVPNTLFWIIAGFFAFRFFDIVKPGLRKLEAIGGGRGIMLDDVAAGIYAGTTLYLLDCII